MTCTREITNVIQSLGIYLRSLNVSSSEQSSFFWLHETFSSWFFLQNSASSWRPFFWLAFSLSSSLFSFYFSSLQQYSSFSWWPSFLIFSPASSITLFFFDGSFWIFEAVRAPFHPKNSIASSMSTCGHWFNLIDYGYSVRPVGGHRLVLCILRGQGHHGRHLHWLKLEADPAFLVQTINMKFDTVFSKRFADDITAMKKTCKVSNPWIHWCFAHQKTFYFGNGSVIAYKAMEE